MDFLCEDSDIFAPHTIDPQETEDDWLCHCGAKATHEWYGSIFCDEHWNQMQADYEQERIEHEQTQQAEWNLFRSGWNW